MMAGVTDSLRPDSPKATLMAAAAAAVVAPPSAASLATSAAARLPVPLLQAAPGRDRRTSRLPAPLPASSGTAVLPAPAAALEAGVLAALEAVLREARRQRRTPARRSSNRHRAQLVKMKTKHYLGVSILKHCWARSPSTRMVCRHRLDPSCTPPRAVNLVLSRTPRLVASRALCAASVILHTLRYPASVLGPARTSVSGARNSWISSCQSLTRTRTPTTQPGCRLPSARTPRTWRGSQATTSGRCRHAKQLPRSDFLLQRQTTAAL
mmetsp:Transcript_151525/g.385224  ORF Transcript_151525/g.385224 Transcript_151525/m.385224 type:complete len:267 (+) Transcript_151525:1160-1960(+)